MGNVKDLNIQNQTYYYSDDMIDIRKFESNLLKSRIETLIFIILVTLQIKSLVIVMVIVIMKIFVA